MAAKSEDSPDARKALALAIANLQHEIERKHLNHVGPAGWWTIRHHATLAFIEITTSHPHLSPDQRESIASQLAQAIGIERAEIKDSPSAYPDMFGGMTYEVGEPMTAAEFFREAPEIASKLKTILADIPFELGPTNR